MLSKTPIIGDFHEEQTSMNSIASPAPTVFEQFVQPATLAASPLRRFITAASRVPEAKAVGNILEEARLPARIAQESHALASHIARTLRERKAGAGRAGLAQNLLQEYALSSQEGVALMCLAEALLRIPDTATRDALIRDKIAQGQWHSHLGKSPSLFVNAATWGLLITGRLVATHSEAGLSASIGRLLSLGGEPLIRKGVDMAMRMMGEQFVTGENIDEALEHAKEREAEGFRYSFDMLGEAALTANDAARYLRDYETAIHAIGRAAGSRATLTARAFPSSCPPCTRATAVRSTTASWASSTQCSFACVRWPSATTSA